MHACHALSPKSQLLKTKKETNTHDIVFQASHAIHIHSQRQKKKHQNIYASENFKPTFSKHFQLPRNDYFERNNQFLLTYFHGELHLKRDSLFAHINTPTSSDAFVDVTFSHSWKKYAGCKKHLLRIILLQNSVYCVYCYSLRCILNSNIASTATVIAVMLNIYI